MEVLVIDCRGSQRGGDRRILELGTTPKALSEHCPGLNEFEEGMEQGYGKRSVDFCSCVPYVRGVEIFGGCMRMCMYTFSLTKFSLP